MEYRVTITHANGFAVGRQEIEPSLGGRDGGQAAGMPPGQGRAARVTQYIFGAIFVSNGRSLWYTRDVEQKVIVQQILALRPCCGLSGLPSVPETGEAL